jgi:hypothetical protein
MPLVAQGAEFHSHNVGGSVGAYWSSCDTATEGQPCAETTVRAAQEANDVSRTGPSNVRDCVSVNQFHLTAGVNPRPRYFTTTIEDPTTTFACGGASVQVAASLANGSVRGELPMENCYPDRLACVPTTPIRVSLDWQSIGEISTRPNIVIRYFSGVRCQGHLLPDRIADASVTGQIDGLPDPLGPLERAGIAFGGETWVGCYD